MNTFEKPDPFSVAFETDGKKVVVKSGVTIDSESFPEAVMLPKIKKGADYVVTQEGDSLRAEYFTGSIPGEAVGGFHIGLNGKILPHSLWDADWRPACRDPRGMVLVADLFWADIYLLNDDPALSGTSRAGASIADGSTPPIFSSGIRAENLNWWTAVEIMASHGKQLLSAAEFALAARGVEEGKNCGSDPKKTTHVPGLRSEWGLEQATGCMWTWGRDLTSWGGRVLLGGYWNTSVAGPRRLSGYFAYISDDSLGARGRCDHLVRV
jgi:hypothetical protein